MDRDIRATAAFQEAQRLLDAAHRPGEGYVSDIADIQLSPDPARLLFTGTVMQDLNGPATTRICEFELETGAIRILTSGPNSDRHARTSPDGRTIAFLSDRRRVSDFQLFLLDSHTQTLTAGPTGEGWIEYLEWSPNGRRILLGVAGHGAELSSGQGAYKTIEDPVDTLSWMPRIIGASSDCLWRKVWIFQVDTGDMWCPSSTPENVWEATWGGDDELIVIASDDPSEGAWYASQLAVLDLTTSLTQCLYKPKHQVALPKVSRSGRHVAFIEAIASDREYVAGDLRLYDRRDGTIRSLNVGDVDVTCIEWRSEQNLLVAGHRGLSTVVASLTTDGLAIKELWESTSISTAGRYATILGLRHSDGFAFVCESFFNRPQVSTIIDGVLKVTKSSIPEPDWAIDSGDIEEVRWQAPDRLDIEGWLLRPKGEPPYATILDAHGGPVLHWRPYWLGRAPHILMLLRRGYAIFLPNPRGSSGRGQAFAARVVGDVGGADTADYLSGIDHLIGLGIADPDRLGITGLSYGGFMTCWLTTQDRRFGAAVSVGPATNHVSHHLTCNIPQFVTLFLQSHYTDLSGAHYSRSPVLQAGNSRTATLLVCGDRDRCTPAEEALQFHHALVENGVDSCVIRYPEEGHGIHGSAAAADFAARCAMWFERYIPARNHDADVGRDAARTDQHRPTDAAM